MNPNASLLLSPIRLGPQTLKNRVVMAPMTRNRATVDHVPTGIMAEYYAQRSGAGLIITEGTSPSPNGSGYARIPGIYSQEQVSAWKKVTESVHARDGKIFVQLMHTGRISHPENMEKGAKILAPSAIAAAGSIYTDTAGMLPHPLPEEMTLEEIESTIEEFVQAARNAVDAGFDGVEVHGANGYLVEQFLRPSSNHRQDEYGGNIEGRAKFLLETVRRVGTAIGFDRVGVRLSPFGVFNDVEVHDGMKDDYVFVARELSKLGIVYLHVLDHSAIGAPEVPSDVKHSIREVFAGTLISAGGYDADKAESDLQEGFAQLISIGRPFISNPDFVERIAARKPLSLADSGTFYTPGEKGYIDYPRSA